MSNNRIEGTMTGGAELDKRFYLPGVTVVSDCPACGMEWRIDCGDQYLSYPKVGEPKSVYFGCDCGHEWEVPVVLSVTLALAEVRDAD